MDHIEIRHVDDEVVAERVRAFFAGKINDFARDGERSVRIAHPRGAGLQIKIKGAGLNGRGIRFGTLHKAAPKRRCSTSTEG